jgi:hypothetical protein
MPVPDFAPGEVLTAAAMDRVGLWKIATGTLSLTTTPTNVTGVFSSDYKQYRLLLNVTNKSASIRVDMKYIVGTTPTSTNYYQAGIGSDYTFNNTLYYQRSNADTQLFGIASSALLSQSIDIYNPNKAALTMHHGTLVDANFGFPYMVGFSCLQAQEQPQSNTKCLDTATNEQHRKTNRPRLVIRQVGDLRDRRTN